MAAITTAQSGHHDVPATWVGGIVPTAGDTVTVLHSLNIVSDWDIGHSPVALDPVYAILINAPGITMTVAQGVTITCRGDIGVGQGTLQFEQGATVVWDSTTRGVVEYRLNLQVDSTNRRNVFFVVNGVPENMVTFTSNPSGGRAVIVGECGRWQVESAVFTDRMNTVTARVADYSAVSFLTKSKFNCFGTNLIYVNNLPRFNYNISTSPSSISTIRYNGAPTVGSQLDGRAHV